MTLRPARLRRKGDGHDARTHRLEAHESCQRVKTSWMACPAARRSSPAPRTVLQLTKPNTRAPHKAHTTTIRFTYTSLDILITATSRNTTVQTAHSRASKGTPVHASVTVATNYTRSSPKGLHRARRFPGHPTIRAAARRDAGGAPAPGRVPGGGGREAFHLAFQARYGMLGSVRSREQPARTPVGSRWKGWRQGRRRACAATWHGALYAG